MRIGKKEFDLKNHCYIMGILNVTPDSFSDGGKFNNLDAAFPTVGSRSSLMRQHASSVRVMLTYRLPLRTSSEVCTMA